MSRLICYTLALTVLILLSACTSNPTPEPTEFSWSVVEEVGRDGDEVHYREHLSNGMTVDRYTREGE